MKKNKINVSILGASGYAGGELLRILLGHPNVEVKQVTSRKFSGKAVSLVHPNLRKPRSYPLLLGEGQGEVFIHPDQLESCDVLFVALPNGASMNIMDNLQKIAPKIIDLGADFRLREKETFENWYHQKHTSPNLLKSFIYGIAELHREKIKNSSLVATAGCEATVSILSLYPLVQKGLIERNVVIDAKMSSSQSGMEFSLSTHHPERAGVVRSYMPSGHRHIAEIEQELPGVTAAISATAIDMVRGLLVTIHATPKKGITEKDVWKAYREGYKKEPFIRIVKESRGIYRYPEPKILQGTNFCDIGFELDERSNRLVVIGAIDNLVKGTAGQAVQAMNLMCGFNETEGLTFPGLHPI